MIKHIYPDINYPEIGKYRALPQTEDYALDAFLGLRIATSNGLPYRVKITREWGERAFTEMLIDHKIQFKKNGREFIIP